MRKSIQWLIIVLMVVQPVTFVYAMTGMDHGHMMTGSVYSSDHDSHANESHSSAYHNPASDDASHSDIIDNCCNTSACSFAYPAVDFLQTVCSFQFLSITIESTFSSTDLPVTIKPPRHPVV